MQDEPATFGCQQKQTDASLHGISADREWLAVELLIWSTVGPGLTGDNGLFGAQHCALCIRQNLGSIVELWV
jgi:hypothetical protein